MVSHQISINPTTSNLKISTISNAYISVSSLSILVKFCILNPMTNSSKVYDKSKSQPLQILTTYNAVISVISHLICITLWILHLMTNPNPNRVFDMERSWSKVGSWNNVGSLN